VASNRSGRTNTHLHSKEDGRKTEGSASSRTFGLLALPFRSRFDRILVDAPCSGTGTLARNPEIKYRLKAADLAAYQARQVAILRNALPLLAPGGRLVYSTCSLEREENEAVIAKFPGAWQTGMRLPGREAGDGFFFAVLTC